MRLRSTVSTLAVVLAGFILLLPGDGQSQVALDEEKREEVTLADGTHVILMARALNIGESGTGEYYYLPTPSMLRLAAGPDGRPQFLLLKYNSESGDVQGGLLHFLMEWGLNRDQIDEAQKLLNEQDNCRECTKRVRGAARLENPGEGESFRIISATLSSDQFTRSLVSSGRAPILPAGRVAVAANLDKNGTQLLVAPFERDMPIGDLSLELDFAYTARVPAAEGRIIFDWSKLVEHYDTMTDSTDQGREVQGAQLKCKKPLMWWKCEVEDAKYQYTRTELHEHLTNLVEAQVIVLEFNENVVDDQDRVAAVRDAFFDYFVSSFGNRVTGEDLPLNQQAASDTTVEISEKYYTFTRKDTSVFNYARADTFRLDYGLAFRRPFSVVQNMKAWYGDVEANYPEALATVNLNDPFFDNTTVRFVLDFDAPRELFEPGDNRSSAINYVTVRLKKRRDAGNDFDDAVTIDAAYIEENGLVAEMTFASGDDAGDDGYAYSTQWSYGGGNLHPREERWENSSTAAVTLVPPVVARDLEVEGDLREMEASDISRVTVQVLYRKFGQPFLENISVSPGQGEALVRRTVFTDRDQKGYVYRLVVNSKRDGKLAGEWSAKVNDDYIFAAIPHDLFEEPARLEEAREAANDAVSQGDVQAQENELSRFEEVLGSDGS